MRETTDPGATTMKTLKNFFSPPKPATFADSYEEVAAGIYIKK